MAKKKSFREYLADTYYTDGLRSRSEVHASEDYPENGIYSMDKVDVWFPVNPHTGLPQDELSRYTDPYLSAEERQSLIDRLSTEKGSFVDKDLSDDELYNILPPRYLNNDLVDINAWRSYVSKEILPAIGSSDVSENGDDKGDDTSDYVGNDGDTNS